MTALFCSVAGRRVTTATLRLPWSGVWCLDADLDEAGAEITGRVSVTLGGLTLSGTVDTGASGAWAEGRHVRVYGGALGWSKELAPRGYHNDAGVKASEVLRGAAQEAGEVLVIGAGLDAKIGADYVRERGAASTTFEAVLPAAVWWVDLLGTTQIAAARPSAELAANAELELLDYDPAARVATLAGAPEAVQIGTVLRPARFGARLSAPVMVRELVYSVSGHEIRIVAHESSDEPGGRLLGPLKRLARAVRDEKLPGLYRYRVVSTSVDRVQLQAVTKGRWPDILPCSLGAGIAGGWADLAPGAIVAVSFLDEDRALPQIVSCTPKGQPGHVPPIAALDGDEVQLAGGGNGVVRKDDLGDGGTFTTAVPGQLTWTGPDGSVWNITFQSAAPGSPVALVIVPVSGAPGKLVTKAVDCSAKVTAG